MADRDDVKSDFFGNWYVDEGLLGRNYDVESAGWGLVSAPAKGLSGALGARETIDIRPGWPSGSEDSRPDWGFDDHDSSSDDGGSTDPVEQVLHSILVVCLVVVGIMVLFDLHF